MKHSAASSLVGAVALEKRALPRAADERPQAKLVVGVRLLDCAELDLVEAHLKARPDLLEQRRVRRLQLERVVPARAVSFA